jgi:hypothetical protein
MEAQRVLTRAGFVCRRAGTDDEGRLGWLVDQPDEETDLTSVAPVTEARLAHLETTVTVLQEALASIVRRIEKLESR